MTSRSQDTNTRSGLRPRVWGIRSGSNGEAHDQFVSRGLIGVGWNELGDLSGVTTNEDIKARMRETYPGESDAHYRTCAGEIRHLVDRMSIGDPVLYLRPKSTEVILGIIQSDYIHSPDEVYSITRKVRWLSLLGQSLLPPAMQKSLQVGTACFEFPDPGTEFWVLFRKASEFAALARRFVSYLSSDEEIRSHLAGHRNAHTTWTELLGRESVPSSELLAALKKMDWYKGAKKTWAPEATENQKKADETFAALKALAKNPPDSVESLSEAVSAMPTGFGMGFVTELLMNAHPDKFWQLNSPVSEATELLGFTALDELPHGKRNDAERYFALRPMMDDIRSALQFAGRTEADFLDVDMLLWEIQRKPENFPERPVCLDQDGMDALVGDLRARHPDFQTFDDESGSWWKDETEYKHELIGHFQERLGIADGLIDTLGDSELTGRFLEALQAPLPSTKRAQNLVSWRSVDSLIKIKADHARSKAFGRCLRDLLLGEGESADRIEHFVGDLVPLLNQVPGVGPAWFRSIPTLALMLQDPVNEILLRTEEFTEFVKLAAGEDPLSGGPLTGIEYARCRKIATEIMHELAVRGLNPTGLLDVQGFIHIAGSRNCWMFQASPRFFDMVGFLKAGHRQISWALPQHAKDVCRGDEVFIWVANPDRGVVAHGFLDRDAYPEEDTPPSLVRAEARFRTDERNGSSTDQVALVKFTEVFPDERIAAAKLKEDPVLKDLGVLKQPNGTVYKVKKMHAKALRKFMPIKNSEVSDRSFEQITTALRQQGLYFADELVANYLLAMQTKRFVILTGISGTGKTKLAQSVAAQFPVHRRATRVAAAPEGSTVITVQPYMLNYSRFVIPAALTEIGSWEAAEGLRSIGKMPVKYDGGKIEQSFYRSPNRNVTVLLFSREFREWFLENFELGDQFAIELNTDEPESTGLTISRVEQQEVIDTLPNHTVVPVRPDWTDHRGLLGYFNPLIRRYEKTPFLELVMAACDEFQKAKTEGREPAPFFAVLDEMNLARVEHYFSDLLSCMESGAPLHLHDELSLEAGQIDEGVAIPRELPLPPNLFVTGTVNVDETTYMFSPKVLDRAFTIELNEVDLQSYTTLDAHQTSESVLDLDKFWGLAGAWRKPEPEDWCELGGLDGGQYQQWLVDLNQLLKGEGRHFGYRVANEISRFVLLAMKQVVKANNAATVAFDFAVLEKVLPKLNGTQQELHELLRKLFAFAVNPADPQDELEPLDFSRVDRGGMLREQHESDDLDGAAEAEGAAKVPVLPHTAHKLWRMARRLRQRGFVSYIE